MLTKLYQFGMALAFTTGALEWGQSGDQNDCTQSPREAAMNDKMQHVPRQQFPCVGKWILTTCLLQSDCWRYLCTQKWSILGREGIFPEKKIT